MTSRFAQTPSSLVEKTEVYRRLLRIFPPFRNTAFRRALEDLYLLLLPFPLVVLTPLLDANLLRAFEGFLPLIFLPDLLPGERERLPILYALEVFFRLLLICKVPFVILLAANAYYLMRKTDPLNHWTFIRETCPELCTLHSMRLFPDDKIFVNILRYLNEKIVLHKGGKMPYDDLISSMASFVAAKAGILLSYVTKLLKEERTPNSEGYRNIIAGMLTIRLGCVIHEGTVTNAISRVSKLAIEL